MRRRVLLWSAFVALAVSACAGPPVGTPSPAAVGDETNDAPAEWTGATRHVPADYPTIQAAVDAADPGDMVLIDKGVYKEEVTVTTPGLTVRGVDRNDVLIDGEFERGNGIRVLADGVVVENLTVMNARVNGVFWTGVRGYRASYVTSINNAVYGIYAFDSGDGLFEHSYASGSPDAGFYIGQCDPCDAVVTDVVAEWNGVGYSGTNASTELYIVNSTWRYNGTGVAPNTLDGELLPPLHDVAIVGNIVHDNGVPDAPMLPWQWAAQGNGVMIAGGHSSYVARNLIFNHPLSGVAIVPMLDANFYMSRDHIIEDNDIRGSGLAHISLSGPSGSGSCFSGNEDAQTMPPALEIKQGCDAPLRLPALFELGATTAQLGRLWEAGMDLTPEVDFSSIPRPGPQPQMPGGADAPVRPAVNVFADAKPDIDAISTPEMPEGLEVTQKKGINIMGVTFASAAGVFFGLYAYVLPLVLYTSWVVLALWDLSRRDLSRGKTISWMAAILVVPFVGVIAYFIAGKSTIPAWQRWTFTAGGMAVYALFLVLGLLVGGIV